MRLHRESLSLFVGFGFRDILELMIRLVPLFLRDLGYDS